MRLYLRVRASGVVAAVVAGVLALLAWPGSSTAASPSPTGATMMMGVFLVIAVPAVVGWACARGDARLERTGVRALGRLDLAFAVGACALVAVIAAALHAVGLADSGLMAARAVLVYLGLLLLAVPTWGWRLAPVPPSLFLLAVAVFGRGEDIVHAARWRSSRRRRTTRSRGR